MTDQTRECTRCHRRLPLSEFHRQTARPDVLMSWCKTCNAEVDRVRKATPGYRFKYYAAAAARRGIDFTLTLEQFVEFWGADCHYCQDPITGVGIDRVDNDRGYVPGNVVSCCATCNGMKSDLSLEDFIERCGRIWRAHGAPDETDALGLRAIAERGCEAYEVVDCWAVGRYADAPWGPDRACAPCVAAKVLAREPLPAGYELPRFPLRGEETTTDEPAAATDDPWANPAVGETMLDIRARLREFTRTVNRFMAGLPGEDR